MPPEAPEKIRISTPSSRRTSKFLGHKVLVARSGRLVRCRQIDPKLEASGARRASRPNRRGAAAGAGMEADGIDGTAKQDHRQAGGLPVASGGPRKAIRDCGDRSSQHEVKQMLSQVVSPVTAALPFRYPR
jgi:hypothetical protein